MGNKYDTILIRYGELSTKGKNRKDFIKRLELNLKNALRNYPNLTYQRTFDRIYIKLTDENPDELKEIISKVFGISSFSFTEKVKSDLDVIKEACLNYAKSMNEPKTFKVITRRHDKSFPLNSDGINRAVASDILKNTNHKVDVHHPDFSIQIEVREEDTYITSEKIPGAGGYPTGINGKVLLLLSGGIDSPVAAYELMKRGLEVEAIHYASPPYTSENAKQKVLDLASLISVYQGSMRVNVVNFTDLQLEIYKAVGDSYAITIMRRMMFRIAERYAKAHNCLAIATGESIGQVASQTLESMSVINEVINIPVIRPLVCMDKLEIINLAKKINTYDLSILPFEDCCTIFDPKNPVTKPKSDKCYELEERFDYESLIEQCMQNIDNIVVYSKEKKESFL